MQIGLKGFQKENYISFHQLIFILQIYPFNFSPKLHGAKLKDNTVYAILPRMIAAQNVIELSFKHPFNIGNLCWFKYICFKIDI